MSVIPGLDQGSSLLSPDGMHAYVEKHYGARAGRIAGGTVAVAIILVCMAVGFTIIRGGWRVIADLVAGRPLPQFTAPSLSATLVSIALLLLVFWVWRLSRLCRQLATMDSSIISAMTEQRDLRLKDQEETVRRLTALEDHTNLPGTLKAILVEQHMKTMQPKLVIKKAFYGVNKWRENCFEVTKTIQEAVVDNQLQMVVNNETMKVGNIFMDQQKKLMLDYSYGDVDRHVEVPETHKLHLPDREVIKQLASRTAEPSR